MTTNNKPIETIRIGNIRAAVWENQSEEGRTYHSVSVTRSYKDGEDWKGTTVFGRDDLPRVELASRKAYEYIYLGAEQSTDPADKEGFADKVKKGAASSKSR